MLMPPSISGLVYNQAASHAHKISGGSSDNCSKYFDVKAILLRWPNLFAIGEDDTVTYLTRVSKAQAAVRLRVLLVEGLFVYFFAKFCHSSTFK